MIRLVLRFILVAGGLVVASWLMTQVADAKTNPPGRSPRAASNPENSESQSSAPVRVHGEQRSGASDRAHRHDENGSPAPTGADVDEPPASPPVSKAVAAPHNGDSRGSTVAETQGRGHQPVQNPSASEQRQSTPGQDESGAAPRQQPPTDE